MHSYNENNYKCNAADRQKINKKKKKKKATRGENAEKHIRHTCRKCDAPSKEKPKH